MLDEVKIYTLVAKMHLRRLGRECILSLPEEKNNKTIIEWKESEA